MNGFERKELFVEIEQLAESMGMTDMTILGRLSDLQDNELVTLRDAMQEIEDLG